MPSIRDSRSGAFWDSVGRPGMVYFAAEAFGKGGTYLLFIALATVLTVDGFGLLNVFVSLLTLLGVAVGVGLPDGIVRFHFVRGRFESALTLGFVVPAILASLMVTIVLPWRDVIGGLLQVPGWLIIAAAAGSGLIAIRQAWLGALRAKGKAAAFLTLRILEPVAFAVALLGLASIGRGLTPSSASMSYLAALGVVGTVGFASALPQLRVRIDRATFGPLVTYSLPLVAHSFAMTGLALFDQIVLQQFLGPTETGIYAFAYRFGMAMSLVALAFSHVWSPLVLERLDAGRATSLPPLAQKSFGALMLTAIVLAWVLPPVAVQLGGPAYQDSTFLIGAVVYAYLWMTLYTLEASILAFRNRTGTLALVSGGVFLLNGILNYLTIPLWGARAAATTTVVCYALLAGAVYLACGRDRGLVPWPRFAFQAVLAAPLVFAPSLVWG